MISQVNETVGKKGKGNGFHFIYNDSIFQKYLFKDILIVMDYIKDILPNRIEHKYICYDTGVVINPD